MIKNNYEEDYKFDWVFYDKTMYSIKSTKNKDEKNYLPRLNG
jgi:hypothetical protein